MSLMQVLSWRATNVLIPVGNNTVHVLVVQQSEKRLHVKLAEKYTHKCILFCTCTLYRIYYVLPQNLHKVAMFTTKVTYMYTFSKIINTNIFARLIRSISHIFDILFLIKFKYQLVIVHATNCIFNIFFIYRSGNK